MKLEFAVLANSAYLEHSKLSIIGIFDGVTADSLPAQHPGMWLVL